ncbi:MAG: NAD(P)H-dependent oxidoreductase [Clostridium sartagoforme]|nr:NAD(P)H-dependent oxidoreductase [Clostridium sartagoforme]
MRVVLLHGHMRKGSTYHISRVLVEKIRGITQLDEIFLPNVIKNGCLGCYRCIKDETKCPYYEAKSGIMKVVEEADILIFTTPTYCMAPSAQLKAFMDLTFTYWLSHKPRKWMFDKKAVVISTCAGTGSKKAIEPVARMLFYWGVPKIYKYGISVQAMSWDGVKDKTTQKIYKDMECLAKRLSAKKAPLVGIRTKAMFNLMRMMQNMNMGSGPDERRYWEDMGWLGKDRPWKKK